MHDYALFGGRLRSALPMPHFPEMAPTAAPTAPTWTFVRRGAPSEPDGPRLLGREPVVAGAEVRLFRTSAGLRLVYDDTGTFEVRDGGQTIEWSPGPAAKLDNVQEDLLGRVLAAAMHASGELCLHASAVALSTGAIAFLAPKHHGKSTLAMALVSRGARLLSDDSLPVRPGPPPMAHPGVPAVRLWSDSLERTGRGASTRTSAGGKHVVCDLAAGQIARDPVPLRAIYVLVPRAAEPDLPAASRTAISTVEGALQLVRHAKIGALLGCEEAPKLLLLATAVADRAPIAALRITRDLERIEAVAAQIFAWHAHAEASWS